MRLIWSMPLIAAAMAGLAACGQSDEAFKASYRNELVSQCTQGAARAAPAGANVEGLCTCMIDGYVANTPVDRLKSERNQSEMPAAAREAMTRCAQAEMQRQLNAAGVSAPGATPAVPTPELPTPPAVPTESGTETNSAE